MSTKRVSRHAREVVPGGGRGIGRAIALELHARVGRVSCADVDLAAAEETVRAITEAGGQALQPRS